MHFQSGGIRVVVRRRELGTSGLVPGRGLKETVPNISGFAPLRLPTGKWTRGCGGALSSTLISAVENDIRESKSKAPASTGKRRGEVKRIERRRMFQIRVQKQSPGVQGGFMSRKVRIGLTYRLLHVGTLVGGGGGGFGGGNNSDGCGGSEGGGNSDDEGQSPPDDERGFHFFTSLYSLLRDRCNSGLCVWAASAFLAGYFVTALDIKHSAHSRSFSKPRMLADGTNGVHSIHTTQH